MEELKQDLKEHMADDKEAFEKIDVKLEALLVNQTIIKAQWKIVGGAAGIITGILGAVIGVMLGSCG